MNKRILLKKIGELIRSRREALRISQTEFGALLGMEQPNLSRYERGEVSMDVVLAAKIQKLLNINFAKVFDDE